MRKLILYKRGEKADSEIIERPNGRIVGRGDLAKTLIGSVEEGLILDAGERFSVEEIFERLPRSLDGAYLAADLVEE